MLDASFEIPPTLDYVATFTWAASGALVGIRKHFDVTGVFVIALLSSLGGGLLRDALFLQRTPILLTDPVYLPLIGVTTVLLSLFTGPLTRILNADTVQKLVDLIDAVGIPIFAVIGMQLAEGRGIPVFGVMFVGVVNGVAGGLLRDVLVRDVPAMLRPGQFVTLFLLLACALFLVLKHNAGMSAPEAAWAAVGVFFLLRVLAVRFNWKTRSLLPESVSGDTRDSISTTLH
jgi:uncharacterized membrane protein YeiH